MTACGRIDRRVREDSHESANLCRRNPAWRRTRDTHFLNEEDGMTGKTESLATLAQKKTQLPDALPRSPAQGYELSAMRKENRALRSWRRRRTGFVFGQGFVRRRRTRETDRGERGDRNIVSRAHRGSSLEVAFLKTGHPQRNIRHDSREIPVPPGLARRKRKNGNPG